MRIPRQPAGGRMPPPLFLHPATNVPAGKVPTDSNTHPAAGPEHHRSPRPGLGDLLAAQALLQAMEPGWEAQTAARFLAGIAAGDQPALHRALARIQLRSLERATPIAERAAQALRLTFDPPAPTPGSRQ